MITIKEIISKVKFEDVYLLLSKRFKLYGSEEDFKVNFYSLVIANLDTGYQGNLIIKPIKGTLRLVQLLYKEDKEQKLLFNLDISKLVALKVEEHILEKFSLEELAAAILYEITFLGFDINIIKNFFKGAGN